MTLVGVSFTYSALCFLGAVFVAFQLIFVGVLISRRGRREYYTICTFILFFLTILTALGRQVGFVWSFTFVLVTLVVGHFCVIDIGITGS